MQKGIRYMDDFTTLLKVIVGSRAHGLHTKDSDYDYRGVFLVPTSEILRLGGTPKQTSWIEGAVDDTQWELGKFLVLATKCNPTILEVFKSPVIASNETGREMLTLFDDVWNTRDVRNAFVGYGLNQRKKFLDDKDGRGGKYAAAYLRSLYLGCQLLSIGDFNVNMKDSPIYDKLMAWKYGDYEIGDVMQTCYEWTKKIDEVFTERSPKETNTDAVNDFLLSVRQKNW